MYYVYAIFNPKHKRIYIGQTKDITVRIELHNEKVFKGYTSRFDGVWELVHTEEVINRSEALKREKELKSFRGREFIKSKILGR